MYCVGRFDESKFEVPAGCEAHSKGYQRATLIDHSHGSVHMGVGIGQLSPGGSIDLRVHANEKGIYVLEGELEVRRGQSEAFLLAADDYALIPMGVAHAFRNRGSTPVRWFEMQAPQPKPPGGWQDTFFEGPASWPEAVPRPRLDDPATRLIGHYQPVNPIVPSGKGVQGLRAYRFMEQQFGATSFFMMRGELDVGGERSYHDHTVEEIYFALSGETFMDIEGERFHLKRGDVAWTGVGACHAFHQVGPEPFRWIETQAPQFAGKHSTRYYIDWEERSAG